MIQKALASLPDRQRDVVMARDVDGRRPPEIAAALGLSLGAVDSLLLRARCRLAASVQSLSAESGAASMMTTAAVSAVGGGVTQIGPLTRFAQMVGDAVAGASYHVAAAMGMVPGMQSTAAHVGPVAAAGLLSLVPGTASHTPAVPPVAVPITASVPPTDTGHVLPVTPSASDAASTATSPLRAGRRRRHQCRCRSGDAGADHWRGGFAHRNGRTRR